MSQHPVGKRKGAKEEETYPTAEKLDCDGALLSMVQVNVTPVGKVQLWRQPSQVLKAPVLLFITMHALSDDRLVMTLLQSASLAQY